MPANNEYDKSNPSEDASSKSNGKDPNGNKKKPITAIVEIVASDCAPIGVVLKDNSQNCSTVAQHAAYLQVKINQSHGKLLGLKLDGTISLCGIFLDNSALLDHNEKLDPGSKYTFYFELDHPDGDGLQAPDELDKLKEQMKHLEGQMCKLMAKQEEEKQSKIREYGDLIDLPAPKQLKGNYNREKLLQLIKHGDTLTSRLYIQRNQECADQELVGSIVDLLAKADEPGKLIGEVIVEHNSAGTYFTWPARLKRKVPTRKTPSVALVCNQSSPSQSQSTSIGLHCLAEYQLANKGNEYIVELYYLGEENFGKCVAKFHYRRLH